MISEKSCQQIEKTLQESEEIMQVSLQILAAYELQNSEMRRILNSCGFEEEE